MALGSSLEFDFGRIPVRARILAGARAGTRAMATVATGASPVSLQGAVPLNRSFADVRLAPCANETSQEPRRFERAFATSFSSVRVHPDSSRAGGTVHALTEREDIYFAPGRYRPGTAAGDHLLAHELAHVVQQRGHGSGSDTKAAELDADLAAEAAVRGLPARPRVAVAAGTTQCFEAWEHLFLGDSYGGKDRKVRLPNGITLSYGQIVALAGDFYRSPEALWNSSKEELQAVLDVMEREKSELGHPAPGRPDEHPPCREQINENNADYEMATTGHRRAEVPGKEHPQSDAPGSQASFLEMADFNAAHFSPDNIEKNWKPLHKLALERAHEAWRARKAGNRDGVDEAQAWLISAFADHFLTDAFAAGHLVSGKEGRDLCQRFYAVNKDRIRSACLMCANADFADPQSAMAMAGIITAVLELKAASLLLKTVHDHYNTRGIRVRNRKEEWTTFGDAHLSVSSDTIKYATLASKASRDSIQEVLSTGRATQEYKALDYIPMMASLDGSQWESVAKFSMNESVWFPVLGKTFATSPADNPLYTVLRSNFIPQIKLRLRMGGRFAGEVISGAGKAVNDVLMENIMKLNLNIRRLYPAPGGDVP